MASHAAALNYWPDSRCAKAFWNQRDVPSYQQLLRHTADWLDPRPAQHWLDLGCGGGQLTRVLWEKSGGTLAQIVALDCAAANECSIAKLREDLCPPAYPSQIEFLHADFSRGLGQLPDASFDGTVSGLAIQYAQSWSEEQDCWTSEAYDLLLREVHRVLKPGGTFVFSVNVPRPSWLKIALYGLPGLFRTSRPVRYVKNALRMLRYGAWLKREARRGRFHYIPVDAIESKLRSAGFVKVEYRHSFAGQAYLFRCGTKPMGPRPGRIEGKRRSRESSLPAGPPPHCGG
jgi:ubiquinone/menaquinone biosynthesis C-methylase UbiE